MDSAATGEGCVGGDGVTPIIDATTDKQITVPPDLERVFVRPWWRPLANSHPTTMGFARYCWFIGFVAGWLAYWIVVSYA